MFYTVYKTINLINDKIYVGSHITADTDDDYLGSGSLLRRALKKYGVTNFRKDVIHVFDNAAEMYAAEMRIVDAAFVADPMTYNLKIGGSGGWDLINSKRLNQTIAWHIAREQNLKRRQAGYHKWYAEHDPEEHREKIRKNHHSLLPGYVNPFANRSHGADSKAKMSRSRIGKGCGRSNSQHGTCWITNGTENKKIKIDDAPVFEKDGWRRGRIIA